MALVRWDPFEDLNSLRGRVNRLFEESLGGDAPSTPRNWYPPCDIYETDSEVVITLDLPGVNKEDLTIELTNEVLTLSGKREHTSEERQEGYLRMERPYGQFQRSFTILKDINREAISAAYNNGVLIIKLSKAEAVKPKQISINING